jgi:hypothetical protein
MPHWIAKNKWMVLPMGEQGHFCMKGAAPWRDAGFFTAPVLAVGIAVAAFAGRVAK